MRIRIHARWCLALALAAVATAAGCVAPLGPGYTIERQRVSVQFIGAPKPRIRIDAEYHLKNSGNQPVREMEVRLPGRRRFHFEEPRVAWDGTTLAPEISTENTRNTLLKLLAPWDVSARHTLHLYVEYVPATEGETALQFSEDAFFLPAEGWSPELLPVRGLFATGGVPPDKWEMNVSVPDGFLLHTSGRQAKSSRKNGELSVTAEQRSNDRYPFVIAGRYTSTEGGRDKAKIILWTRKPQDAAAVRGLDDALFRTMDAYDAAFGARTTDSSTTWIVECPLTTGCFTNLTPATARLLGTEKESVSAEMVSLDTMAVDLSVGMPKLVVAAAPSLAATWLGYAQNPEFYEEAPPLSVLPAFAASIAQEGAQGADSRAATIRRALQLIPERTSGRGPEDPAVLRAKSFLFFYALQDRYGQDKFRKAVSHMLGARMGRGLELSDLIAAFGQETDENVAEFVRIWMKRPGVPQEFRARYQETATTKAQSEKETAP